MHHLITLGASWISVLWLLLAPLAAQPSCTLSADSLDRLLQTTLARQPLAAWIEAADTQPLATHLVAELALPCALPDTLLAQVSHCLGVACINQAHDFAAARHHYRRAIALRERHLSPTHPALIKGYNNLGSCYLTMTREGQGFYLDSARWALRRSLDLNLQRSNPTDILGRTYLYLSRVADQQGDIDNARLYLEGAIARFGADRSQARLLAIVHTDLAGLLANVPDQVPQALFHARQSLRYYEHRPLQSWRDSLTLGDWLVNFGVALIQADSLAQALRVYRRALALKQPYATYLPTELAAIANNQAIIHNRLGQHRAALARLREALTLNQAAEATPALAGNYDNLGDAFAGLGQYDSALTAYQTAIRYFSPGFDAEPLTANPPVAAAVFYDPRGLLGSLHSKARTLLRRPHARGQALADLQQAYQTCQTADSLLQRIRRSYQAYGSKEALVTLARPIYSTALEVCYALAQATGDRRYQAQAFAWAENSKAVILLDAVQQSRRIQRGWGRGAQQRLQAVQTRKVYYEKLLVQVGDSDLALEDSVIRYRQLEQQWLAQLQPTGPTTAPLVEQVQASLPGSDHGLLAYFVGDSVLYGFLLTPDALVMRRMNLDQPLGQAVGALRRVVSQPEALDRLDETLPVLRQRAAALYQTLLAPLGRLPRYLTIVRDDVLELLPFEVLLTEAVAAEAPMQDWPYLIRQHVISYAFSARSQQAFARNVIRPRRDLLAFAPVRFEGVASRLPLPALYATERELAAVAEVLAGTRQLYVGEQASLARFLAEAEDYAVLYLASHGLLHEQDPRFNGVALADSILHAADLYPLRLNAELVVLRACESGAGKLLPGEGVISLGHAFAQTGAKSVFLTQWVVPDASRFMRHFMQRLQQGAPKDLALHEAKLALAGRAHPFFWAAAELRGDMRPMLEPDGGPVWAAWGVGGMVLLLGLWLLGLAYRAWRRRRARIWPVGHS